MFFGNVLDQLSSAALLDVTTLESIAADVDAKVESLQEWYIIRKYNIWLVTFMFWVCRLSYCLVVFM